MAAALSKLLPNLGGPNAVGRKLYSTVVRSMVLYVAPVWSKSLKLGNVAVLRRAQRTLDIRAVRGYRTVSAEAASVLAGSSPWDLEAGGLASLYEWRSEALRRGNRPAPREIEAQRMELQRSLMMQWMERLAHPSASHQLIAAVRPVFHERINRDLGTLDVSTDAGTYKPWVFWKLPASYRSRAKIYLPPL